MPNFVEIDHIVVEMEQFFNFCIFLMKCNQQHSLDDCALNGIQ